jgi:hypothetical protein
MVSHDPEVGVKRKVTRWLHSIGGPHPGQQVR